MKLKMFAIRRITPIFFVFLLSAITLQAQTTAFTYQGRLTDANAAANGTYQMQFSLFDVNGNQISSTIENTSVTVAEGSFTVHLDFGAAAFSGGNRFLQIAVKRPADASYTTLGPRQPITSVPSAIRSLSAASADTANSASSATTANTATNAAQLGGIAANQYVLTTDPRLSSTGGGGGSFINNTTTQQSFANFNISGNGTAGGTLSANVVNSHTQYNINGQRVLSAIGATGSAGRDNVFVGVNAGIANINGSDNTFVGSVSGNKNFGSGNSFLGSRSGANNTEGGGNSFFGSGAGANNTTGSQNAFFGTGAGNSSTVNNNSFFGANSGGSTTIGTNNAFFGRRSGVTNTTGGNNSFFGFEAGVNNITGENNTIIGASADVSLSNLNFATAIGAGATVANSNTIVLGRSSGADKVRIPGLGTAGITALCRNGNLEISTCSSSLRYKTNIAPFTFGLNLVNRLKPITFNWKDGGMADLGLGAEDVAAIEPLLVTYNDKGEVEGVKYDRVGVVLLNAVKEQQAQIERQEEQIKFQQQQIDALKKLVCLSNSKAEVCREKRNEK